MTDEPTSESAGPGVYARRPDGQVVQVHAYEEGDYTLADIAELFALGRPDVEPDGRPALVLGAKEARQLKALADATSFDHEEGLIRLCLDLHRFAITTGAAEVRFWSDL